MADLIQVAPGAPPWAPAPDARLAKEYRYYEMPLCGIVEQHGVRYLFACLAGELERVNLWVYAHVTADEESTFDRSEGVAHLADADIAGPVVVALAVDELGIVASERLDAFTRESLIEANQRLHQQLERIVEEAGALRDNLLSH